MPCCAPVWKASLPRSLMKAKASSMRFYVAAQSALTEYLIGLTEGQSVSDSLIDEIIECTFNGLYSNVLLAADDQ